GVQQQESARALVLRQASQPGDTLGTEPRQGRRAISLEDHAQKVRQLRRALQLCLELFCAPQQLVGVADDARPAELTDTVDHLPRLAAAECEVATVEDALNAAALDVSSNCVERTEVAMDVGDDRKAH